MVDGKFSVKEFITNSLCNTMWWKEKFLPRLVIWLKGEDMLHAECSMRGLSVVLSNHTLHYAGFSSGMLYP